MLAEHELSSSTVVDQWVEIEGMRLHYLSAGSGETILFIHGWPTSAYLYRQQIAALAQSMRVVALDLPGFGKSDKPLHAPYTFDFYDRILTAFAEHLGMDQVTLVGHDIGGPIGVFWAERHQSMLKRLVLLNTLIYPEISLATRIFVAATFVPVLRDLIISPAGIKAMMRLGVNHKERLTQAVLAAYQEPFREHNAREVLLKTLQQLGPDGFKEIASNLSGLTMPVALIYGEDDRILPDIAKTMRRLKQDLPHAQLAALPGCGHFLQEDEPEKLAALLHDFISAT